MNKHSAHVVVGKNSSNSSNNYSNSAKASRQRRTDDPLGDIGVNVGNANANMMAQAHTVLPRIVR